MLFFQVKSVSRLIAWPHQMTHLFFLRARHRPKTVPIPLINFHMNKKCQIHLTVVSNYPDKAHSSSQLPALYNFGKLSIFSNCNIDNHQHHHRSHPTQTTKTWKKCNMLASDAPSCCSCLWTQTSWKMMQYKFVFVLSRAARGERISRFLIFPLRLARHMLHSHHRLPVLSYCTTFYDPFHYFNNFYCVLVLGLKFIHAECWCTFGEFN